MSPQASSWFKRFITVACLVGSAAAIYNVNFEVTPLQKQAEHVACGDGGCAQTLGVHRSPISHEFTFQIQTQSTNTRRVKCARSLLLFGTYDCEMAP